jgi:PilZ domain
MASAPAYFPKPQVDDDRRIEPRFGAEGDVTLMVLEDANEVELAARLLDFSLHGLRIHLARELKREQEVRVIFSWGEATTRVMWTTPLTKGFETGLQLF